MHVLAFVSFDWKGNGLRFALIVSLKQGLW